jgi:hypothetical protein
VGKLFRKYQWEAATTIRRRGCLIESDIQELLALDNILLLKPGQVSPLMSSIFNEFCLESIQIEVQKIFGIQNMDIPTDTKASIENILRVCKFIQCTCQFTQPFFIIY